ncbi:MAG: hypothetical protein GX267_04310 [Fibrobacter sp.]|jgi:hypothetical protein|nr:hypothetical protein [Fibrobacter sp.]
MKYENQMFEQTIEQMSLPLFQPLRLWSPRPSKIRADKSSKGIDDTRLMTPVRTFAMKGRYVNDSQGVRRMVIAGKIFKTEGALRLS